MNFISDETSSIAPGQIKFESLIYSQAPIPVMAVGFSPTTNLYCFALVSSHLFELLPSQKHYSHDANCFNQITWR